MSLHAVFFFGHGGPLSTKHDTRREHTLVASCLNHKRIEATSRRREREGKETENGQWVVHVQIT